MLEIPGPLRGVFAAADAHVSNVDVNRLFELADQFGALADSFDYNDGALATAAEPHENDRGLTAVAFRSTVPELQDSSRLFAEQCRALQDICWWSAMWARFRWLGLLALVAAAVFAVFLARKNPFNFIHRIKQWHLEFKSRLHNDIRNLRAIGGNRLATAESGAGRGGLRANSTGGGGGRYQGRTPEEPADLPARRPLEQLTKKEKEEEIKRYFVEVVDHYRFYFDNIVDPSNIVKGRQQLAVGSGFFRAHADELRRSRREIESGSAKVKDVDDPLADILADIQDQKLGNSGTKFESKSVSDMDIPELKARAKVLLQQMQFAEDPNKIDPSKLDSVAETLEAVHTRMARTLPPPSSP